MTKPTLYAYPSGLGDWMFSFDDDQWILTCADETRARRAARLYERYGYPVVFDYPLSVQAEQAMAERDIIGSIFGWSVH